MALVGLSDSDVAYGWVNPSDIYEVCHRVNELVNLNTQAKTAQRKIRDLMDGGVAGLRALVGQGAQRDMEVLDQLPAGNPILSGITHLSTKLQQVPDLRIVPEKDTDQAKKHADIREHILRHQDEAQALEAQMPQVGMWLPGYGFAAWVGRERVSPDGLKYLHFELRDPMECYPGDWGVDQQPEDVAFVRHIPLKNLLRMYPDKARDLLRNHNQGDSQPFLDMNTSAWSNTSAGVRVAEYVDWRGTWYVIPEKKMLLEHIPNPCTSGPLFVLPKRFAFNKLQGHYDHVIGLMAMHARLTVLQAQWTQDNVHTEALALDCPVPTPIGWTTMGEIETGDIILGSDGLPVEVLEAKPVQYDRDCYVVTFEDGSTITASDGHLWQSKMMASPMQPKVRTTEQMFNSRGKFRVPASRPWKLPEADLPIDPYVLGMWLGDGSRANATISVDWRDMAELVTNIEATGYTVRKVTPQAGRCDQVYVSRPDAGKGQPGSGLHGELGAAGLLGNKHVPPVYFRGSIDQRLALVQGLMDADGCVATHGQCKFTNTDRGLIDAMVELLRSLGEVPHLNWEADTRSRQGGYWHVTFTPRNFVPFRMARKAERVKMHARGPEWVTIKSIEKADSVPVRCIAVASDDHLFLAGQGAHVTHNTNIIGQAPGQYNKGRFAINEFDPGTQIVKPVNSMPFQAFQAIDRLERQLRTTARYSVTDDAQSPTSWATGAGLEELGASMTLEVRTYQTVLRRAIERQDSLRLEWEDRTYGSAERSLVGEYRGQRFSHTYQPSKAIGGHYTTRRKYGFMAGWDESRKLVGGLQLTAAKIIPRAIMRENLDGLDESLPRVEALIDAEMAEDVLRDTLLQMAQNGDPRAITAVIKMIPAGETRTILEDVFMPEEAEEVPPEQAPLPEAPPDLQSLMGDPQMLARMSQSGSPNSGGVQVMMGGGQ